MEKAANTPTKKNGALIGAVLGIALVAGLIWFLFFRKKADGSSIAGGILKKKPEESKTPTQTTKTVYVQASASGGGGGSTGFPLKRGSKGASVTKLQQALLKAGYDLGKSGADGDWGSLTDAAMQKAFGKTQITDANDLEQSIGVLAARALMPLKGGTWKPKTEAELQAEKAQEKALAQMQMANAMANPWKAAGDLLFGWATK